MRGKEEKAFHQQVRMAAVQVAGLRPEELAQALGYEVEPLTGIPAAEAEVTYESVADPDPTVRVYDVTVRRRRAAGSSGPNKGRFAFGLLVAAGLLALAAIAVDFFMLHRAQTGLEREARVRRPLQAALNDLKRQAEAAETEAGEIRRRRDEAVRAQDVAAERRTRHAEVLAELAVACGGRAAVTEIAAEKDGEGIDVRAVGLSAEAAAETMRDLAARLAAKGWILRPRQASANESGATTAFSFELKRRE